MIRNVLIFGFVVQFFISISSTPLKRNQPINSSKGIGSDFSNCTYAQGKFLCKTQQICISLAKTCDGICDCLNCTDENKLCWISDEFKCRTCRHTCLTTPSGSQCFDESDSIWKEIEECDKDAPCQQRCVKYQGVERCSCGEHYNPELHTLGRSCVTDAYKNALIYSTERDIKSFDFVANATTVILENVNCTALTAAHMYVYYGVADERTGYVYKSTVVPGASNRLFETHSPNIFSIDVDWLTGNIYFTTNEALGVCSRDDVFCALIKTLKFNDSCHLAVAPRFGLLFHSLRALHLQYEDFRIIKSSMDGSDETILTSEGLRHPMAITIDEDSQKVYWMNCALSEIESIQEQKDCDFWSFGYW